MKGYIDSLARQHLRSGHNVGLVVGLVWGGQSQVLGYGWTSRQKVECVLPHRDVTDVRRDSMHPEISKQTKPEHLEPLRGRHAHTSKLEKTKILDEFVAIVHCHRKYAIRLLTGVDPRVHESTAPARRIDSEATRQVLIVLWEAADRICGKRLRAILPDLIAAMERHGHLALDPIVRQHRLAISPATIDRLLAPIRGAAGHRRKRKRATNSSRQIPIRTFADWSKPDPGFLEVDFVCHGGDSIQGTFLWSLVATDVCSGWTAAIPLLAREQSLVLEGLAILRRQFPVPIRGIDTDNDGAFINETLQGYCQEEHLEFTRSRACQENEQAWIEQKNGSVVRRFVGYRRPEPSSPSVLSLKHGGAQPYG